MSSPALLPMGQMTLPRQLMLVETTDGLKVAQQFASSSKATTVQPANTIRLNEGTHQSTQLHLSNGESVLFVSDNQKHRIKIKRTSAQYLINIERSANSDVDQLNQHFSHQYTRELKVNGPLSVEWIFSEAGLEMLLADGLMSITQRSLPERP